MAYTSYAKRAGAASPASVATGGGTMTPPKPAGGGYTRFSDRVKATLRAPAPMGEEERNAFNSALGTPSFDTNSSTPQMNTGPTIQSKALDIGKDVGRSIARSIASTGVTLAKKIDPRVEALQPEDFHSYFGQALVETVFGTDPNKAIEDRIVEAEPKIKKWGQDLQTLAEDPNLNPRERLVVQTLADISDKHPKFTAFTGIMGSVGLDLSGFGGLEKNVYRGLVKEGTEEGAFNLLRGMGVDEDLARTFAPDVVAAGTEKDAKALFQNIVKLQEATKATPTGGYTRVAERQAAEDVPRETIPESAIPEDIPESLHPLAERARSYETAEEFKASLTPTEYRQFLNETQGDNAVTASARATGAKSRKAGDYLYAQDRGAFDAALEDVRTGKNPSYHEDISDFYTAATKEPEQAASFDAVDATAEMTQLSENVENLRQAVEATEDATSGMPGRSLAKFANASGDLPEVRSTRTFSGKEIKEKRGKFASEGDVLLQDILGQTESGNGDVVLAQQMVDDYRAAREQLKGLKEAYKTAKKEKASVAKLEKISQQEAKLTDTLRAIEEKYPGLGRIAGGLDRGAQAAVKKAYKVGAARSRSAILERLQVSGTATADVRKQISDFAKATLSTKDRGKALTLVRDAKTQRDLVEAFSRINRWGEDAEKRALKGEILKAQRRIMDSPSVAIEYKDQIKALLDEYELKGKSEKTIQSLAKTQRFIDDELAKGNDVTLPRAVMKALDTLQRKPLELTTTSELKGALAEMESLEQLGRTKIRVREDVIQLRKDNIMRALEEQGTKPLEKRALIRPKIGERLTMTQKAKNVIISAMNQGARIDRARTPMDAIFDLLDGGRATYDGANFRFFKGQVDAGYGRYITRTHSLQEPVIEMAAKLKLDDRNFERMGIVAAREQDGGMEKLIASGFEPKEINEVVLTKNEQAVLDKMRETFDSQFPEIKDTMRRVYNQPVEKVKNYFSFMTDWKAMDDSEVFQRFGSAGPDQYGAPKKNVDQGFTVQRKGGAQKIKVNAMDVFMRHTDNTSYLLELGETSKFLGEIAASPKYAELVGDAGQLMVREWLDVVARKGGAAGASTIPILDTLRRNVGAGILGLKLSTVAIQPTSLLDGMGFIGVKYGMRGVNHFLNDKEFRQFVLRMPEIKDRLGGEFALRELSDDKFLENIQRKGFIPLQLLDQFSAASIAAGAYERKMVELGKVVDLSGAYNAEALEYAQLAVRRTQSSGSFKDVPLAVSRGALTGNRSLDRAVLQFQNFLLTRWSRIRHDALRAGINTKDPTKAVPIFAALAASALAAAGIRLGVDRTLDFVTGNEPDKTASEDLQRNLMFEATGNVPFLGTVSSMMLYDGEFFPILDAPKTAVDGLNRAITSKSEKAKLRGLTDLTSSVSTMLGIPGSAQAGQLTKKAIGPADSGKKSTGGGGLAF